MEHTPPPTTRARPPLLCFAPLLSATQVPPPPSQLPPSLSFATATPPAAGGGRGGGGGGEEEGRGDRGDAPTGGSWGLGTLSPARSGGGGTSFRLSSDGLSASCPAPVVPASQEPSGAAAAEAAVGSSESEDGGGDSRDDDSRDDDDDDGDEAGSAELDAILAGLVACAAADPDVALLRNLGSRVRRDAAVEGGGGGQRDVVAARLRVLRDEATLALVRRYPGSVSREACGKLLRSRCDDGEHAAFVLGMLRRVGETL
ncbi:MAG: hypothetical protein BJ554DRAFT_1675 [Olpidium bornovanus]|uniref:Uncharacterized protein n=1 Tax=Olpidium bornovanus TaxID=278681 RepID=A0A8H7ZRE6_9FUNG|nr:MAG: hypothetical protein BJ554DRAFT_1675 [Olpidium bornovanus]